MITLMTLICLGTYLVKNLKSQLEVFFNSFLQLMGAGNIAKGKFPGKITNWEKPGKILNTWEDIFMKSYGIRYSLVFCQVHFYALSNEIR